MVRRERTWTRRAAAGLLTGALAACAPQGGPERGGPATETGWAGLTEVQSFGSNPGGLGMFYYAPPSAPPHAPLVVVLHGCDQGAANAAASTGWNTLADRVGFYVVYPEQSYFNNIQYCFNWFFPSDYERGSGEAGSIEQMVDDMKARFSIDPARVYASGLSAGGFMVSALLAGAPDVFAGGALMEGGPAGCASGVWDASTCMAGVDESPAAWAAAARALAPSASAYPVVSIFHGTNDGAVSDANLVEATEQWTALHGADQTPEVDDTFRGHRHRLYLDAAGRAVVETYHVQGLGHAVSVDPGSRDDQGGATGGEATYSEDRNLWAAYYAARTWGLVAPAAVDAGQPDARPADASSSRDAEGEDTSPADTGGPADAQEIDAGTPDLGPRADAEPLDAEPLDAEGHDGAGDAAVSPPEDAGAPDAEARRDAGAADTGIHLRFSNASPGSCACVSSRSASPGVGLLIVALFAVAARRFGRSRLTGAAVRPSVMTVMLQRKKAPRAERITGRGPARSPLAAVRTAVLLSVVMGAVSAACSTQPTECRVGADCASGVCLGNGTCGAPEDRDAGLQADAGAESPDAVVSDAGAEGDAAAPDAGPTDTGVLEPDAAEPDAAEPDAQPADALALDAAAQDALPRDAAPRDAGIPVPSDGGSCSNRDLVVDRGEVSFVVGRQATFRLAQETAVDTAGRGDAGTFGDASLRSWDLSGALANDTDEQVTVEPVQGKWFESDFPGATYASWLDGSHDTYGVFEATNDALLMRGMASATDGLYQTRIIYDPPVVVLQFPVQLGGHWESVADVTGEYNGLPLFFVRHVYVSDVDAAGTLETPYGRFPVLRVRVEHEQQALTFGIWATTSSVRSFAFVAECFGTVATIRSEDDESDVEFTTASEVRRLAP